MLRKNTRQRREYLYRKSLEGKERERYEKKRRLNKALAEGKAAPDDLISEANALVSEIHAEGGTPREPEAVRYYDSEYARAGLRDPKIYITTARDPSSRLTLFAKELHLILPNAQKINRGNHVLPDLVNSCRANDATDLVIVHEHRGNPDGLVISHLPFGPTAYFGVCNCVLRHDVQGMTTISQAYPHLIFNNFNTKLGERVMAILKYIFPVPKEESHRVVTFANQNDYISFRHHSYKKDGGDVQLEELGPRFELKLFQIKLGTAEDKVAENEWILHPFVNSAKHSALI